MVLAEPAWAQNIFNSHKGSDKNQIGPSTEPKKSPIFNAPKGAKPAAKNAPSKKQTVTSQDFLKKSKALQKYTSDKVALYEDWTKSGKKPQTAEEITAYAQASRARAQLAMQKRREGLVKKLEANAAKQEQKHQANLQLIAANKAKAAKAAKTAKAPVSKAAQKTAATKEQAPTTSKKKPIYVKPKLTQKPAKNFQTF